MGLAPNRFRYQVDSRDRIRFVDTAWLDFARQNNAAELTEAAVIGQSLWEFIAGRETQHLYRLIFDAVRKERKIATVPFRCDSPECRRYMELSITLLPGDGLEFLVSLIREELRAYVALLDPNVPREEDFVTVCSWCKRVFLPDDDWVEVETGVRHLQLFSDEALPQITHGMCETCASAFRLDPVDG